MNLKADLLFSKIPDTGKYEYGGEYPLMVGTRRIEPKELVDLEEIGLPYAPEDKRLLQVEFVDWTYKLLSTTKKKS